MVCWVTWCIPGLACGGGQEDADVERQVFHDSAAGLILYVNAHQASMLGDEGGDERGRGEDGVGKRRRVDVEDEPGANLAGQGRRLGLPVALSISRPACAPGTETPVTNTTALTRGGGEKEKGHVQRLWEWTLTTDRTMSGSSCLVRALQHISDSSAANDSTTASSEHDVDGSTRCPGLRGGDDAGGVGGVGMDEMARIELNLREVLRHMWQQLVSKNKDMDIWVDSKACWASSCSGCWTTVSCSTPRCAHNAGYALLAAYLLPFRLPCLLALPLSPARRRQCTRRAAYTKRLKGIYIFQGRAGAAGEAESRSG